MGGRQYITDLEAEATVLSQLKKHAEAKPNKSAFVFVDKDLNQRILTRMNVWDKTRRYAAVLRRLGIAKGDIVCNTLVNSPERLLTYFGTLASGATPSQGQLLLADGSDLIHNLKVSESKAIIYDPRDINGAKRLLDQIKFTDEETGTSRYRDLPHLEYAIEIDAQEVEEDIRWINAIDKEEDMFYDESVSKEDIAMVFVTSGTTGSPKLVPHKHSTLLAAIDGYYMNFAYIFNNMTMFNMNSLGWVGGFPGWYIFLGSRRVLVDLTRGPPTDMGPFLINTINQTNTTVGFMIARDIQHVLDALHEDQELINPLEGLLTGGGPVHTATMDALGPITEAIMVGYGGTEFLMACNITVTKRSEFKDLCAGYPLDSVRIVGSNDKNLPVGDQGEILVSSRTMFTGYLNDPEKSAAAFTEDGWYRTGDIGYFNKKDQLFVLSRKDDAIKKDGFIHYPGWMEQLINKHPRIETSVVIGIPDPVHGEEICLCYTSVTGEDIPADGILGFCKQLFLTDEDDKMTPLPKHIFKFDEMITNNNGKVDRKKMREEILLRLNSDQ